MNLGLIIALSVLFFSGVVTYNKLFLKFKISQYIKLERQKSEEINRLRQEMARDFHDEMGNNLASIISMVNILSLRLKDQEIEIQSILDRIEKSSKDLFEGTREFMWTIDPEHDNLDEILIFLRDYGVKFFDETNIDFEVSINLPSESGKPEILPGSSRHIIAILKEAMTNCLKHSSANKVILSCEESSGSYSISLEDNGIGWKGPMGRGLKNMQIRAIKVSAYLRCRKLKPGFRVELKFDTTKKGIYELYN